MKNHQNMPAESREPDAQDYERFLGFLSGLVSGFFVGMGVALVMATPGPAIASLAWIPVAVTVILGGVSVSDPRTWQRADSS